ncbi:MAG: SIS domain-containing protein [archaeon]
MNDLEDHKNMIDNFPLNEVIKISDLMIKSVKQGKTIFFLGCGGSAADAQHLAAELIGSYRNRQRLPISAIALTTNTSVITAIANDFGFDSVFERQVSGLVREGDIVVGISTSGNSQSIINALLKAKEKKAITIGFLGNTGGMMKNICDYALLIPAKDTPRIQEGHILAGHILCGLIEDSVTIK